MTTVFREIPSKIWLLLFYTDEITTVQNLFEITGQTFPETMPLSLCNALEILMCSQNAQYVSRQHQEKDVNLGHLDGICQTLPSNHHDTLLFTPVCVDAQKILKQTIMQVLSTAQNAHVKFMTVSYPENFLRAETNKLNTSAISVRGEKMQSLLKKKDDRWNWLQLQVYVGVWKAKSIGNVRWYREGIVSFSTTGWAWELRRAVQRHRNILHRAFAERNMASLPVWTQSYLGYWLGCK